MFINNEQLIFVNITVRASPPTVVTNQKQAGYVLTAFPGFLFRRAA